jgi:glycosyltransferase involved in cell wall biosynthesis
MMLPPRVSVIMPFLNLERFIGESVNSVLAQTYGRWELLLVDDGSTDGSGEIARGYAARHPDRIRYLGHSSGQNRGASAARNLGLAHARGEFIALLDGDDIWLRHKLEQQVALLDATPTAGMVYGNTQWWYSWNHGSAAAGSDWVPPLGFPAGSLVPPPELLRRFMAGSAAVPATCSVLIRRSAVDAAGGFEERFRYVFTDHVFYTKLLLSTTVLVADGCWDRYRRRPGSSYSSIEGTSAYVEKRREWLHWTRGYLRDHGWEDTDLWRTLEGQIRRYEHPRAYAVREFRRKLPRRTRALLRGLGSQILPVRTRRWLRARWLKRSTPRAGEVDFGSFGRVTPIRRVFDPDRGTPVGRYYLEAFLRAHQQFPPEPILYLGSGTPEAQVTAGLSTAPSHRSPSDVESQADRASPSPASMEEPGYSTVIVQGVPSGSSDLVDALRVGGRALRPGGVLLGVFPALARFGIGEAEHGPQDVFTLAQVRAAAESVFGGESLRVETRGNILAALASLHGLAAEELRPDQLAHSDPSFPVVILLHVTRNADTHEP